MNIEFSLALLGILATGVDAHGYVRSPRSRNWVARADGKSWGGTADDPKIDYGPHSLNRGGICGINTEFNYSTPLNTFGNPMPVNIQANFTQGQEIELEVVLTAHHMGHFEFKACAIQPYEIPTQACFDQNPLEFVEDIFYNAPADPNYPGRAYLPTSGFSTHSITENGLTGLQYKHKFRLPANLVGDLVLIQWHYITSNSCLPEGYGNYTFPAGFEQYTPHGACGPL